MLTESANVVAVEPDGLWVETLKQSSCTACSARSGCGQHVLARYMGEMTRIKAVFENGQSDRIWKTGDEVIIGIDERALVLGALLVYFFPLVAMLGFSAFFYYMGYSEVWVALAAAFGLVGSGILLKRKRSLVEHKRYDAATLGSLDVVVLEKDE